MYVRNTIKKILFTHCEMPMGNITLYLQKFGMGDHENGRVRNLKFAAYLKSLMCRNIHKVNKVRSNLLKVIKAF